MIAHFIYRLFFKRALDRLEVILFIDRNGRRGRSYNAAAARHEINIEGGTDE